MYGEKLTASVTAWKVMDDKELVEALEQLAEDMKNHGRVSDGCLWKSPQNDDEQIRQFFSKGAVEFFDGLTERLEELEDHRTEAESLRDEMRFLVEDNEGTLEDLERILHAEEEDATAEPAVSH